MNGFQSEIGLLLIDASGRVAGASDSVRAWAGGESLVGRPQGEVLAALSAYMHPQGLLTYHPLPLYGRKPVGTAFLIMPSAMSPDQAVLSTLSQELQAVMDASFDEVHLTDGQGTTLRSSSKSQEYFGLNPEEIAGMTLEDFEARGLVNPPLVRQVIEKRQRVTTLQETSTGRRLAGTGHPIFDADGSLVRIIITSQDITPLERLTAALKESRSLVQAYQQELSFLRQQQGEGAFLPRGKVMQQVVAMARRVAQVDSTTLIFGETGVGKEVLARAIHKWGPRHEKAFVAVNCGAIPEPLLESELFGYVGGAFTGAQKEGKLGLIEAAHGGTLFLDEIGDMPLPLQVKLLRVIQQQEVTRLGTVTPTKVNVRIIAATHRNLEQMAQEGRFRQDLFYRLNVVPLLIPPLRDRREDILSLANHFLDTYSRRYGAEKRLSPQAADALLAYRWPGNIRELENTIERLVVTVEDGTIMPDHLPQAIADSVSGTVDLPAIEVRRLLPLKEAVSALENELIRKAYSQYGSSYRAAKALGVHQSTVIRKLHRSNAEGGQFDGSIAD